MVQSQTKSNGSCSLKKKKHLKSPNRIFGQMKSTIFLFVACAIKLNARYYNSIAKERSRIYGVQSANPLTIGYVITRFKSFINGIQYIKLDKQFHN